MFFFFQAEDGIRDYDVTGVQTCALPIWQAPEGLFEDPAFLTGMKVLGKNGFTYDTWHYYYQNRDFAEMAKKIPGTQIVLDHFGTPLGVGPYADKREEIFTQW